MLFDSLIRKAKTGSKLKKLFDSAGTGLYLELAVSGSKLWRLKCRLNKKPKLIALGAYPAVSLAFARTRAAVARTLVAEGVDPIKHRAALEAMAAAQGSFAAVALEYIAAKLRPTKAASHVDRVEARFKRDVFPYLGERKPAEITAPEVLAVLRRIEGRGAIETAHRAMQTISQVFRYAVATGRAITDPTRDLRGALTDAKSKHYPAPLDPKRIGTILTALDGYAGTPVVRAALRLGPLTFVRPGELRRAEWADVYTVAAEWRYLVTKTKTQLIVPLSPQAMAIIEELRPLTGKGRYLFPGARSGDRPMSDNAVLMALRTLGIEKDEMVGHSWRAIARTHLEETLGYPAHIVEMQLAHAVRDPLGRAYNRTTHLTERRAMMVAWGDYLGLLKANVVQSNP